MRFSAIHKVASYLMALSAYGALVFSGELGPVTSILGLLGILASWFWEAPRVRPERWAFWWNALAVLALAYTIVSVLAGESVVNGFARFLVFLLLAKLFSRVTSRDYLWAYVLSFSLLVAGTALNAGVSYAVFFLGYVVFATWAFILFHLRREMEENFLLKHSDDSSSEKVEVERILNSRRIVGPSFLAGTSVVSLAIFVAATLLFFLFPRIGFGLFFEKSRSGISMAGFSDGVRLGKHGRIRDDDTVVMRVVVDDPAYQGKGAPPLHWRGVAFDRYGDGRWSRSQTARSTKYEASFGARTSTVRLTRDVNRPAEHVVRQEIYLEPMDTTVLFGASEPRVFELPNQIVGLHRRTAEIGRNGEVRFLHTSGLRYVVLSDTAAPASELLAAAPDADPQAMFSYLALPETLPQRVRDLARRVTAGAVGPYAKATAIQQFLSREYAYTLEQESDDAREPLDYFLFDRKQGHCEYFSSAMAVMLRAVGVPTRNVNGFLGGEWNEYGSYLAIRSGDAHSWVEVWFDGVGWVTFDPTPPAGAASHTGQSFLDKLRRLLDTLRLEYFKWVIEYDLSRQVGLMRSIGGAVRSGKDRLQGTLGSAWRFFWNHAEEVAAGGGLLLAAMGLYAWRRRKRGTGRKRRGGDAARGNHPALAIWLRAASRLSRRGWVRGSAQTPREFAAHLLGQAVPGARAFSALTEIYYVARFGERAQLAPTVDLDEARRLADAVKAELAARRSAPAP